MGEKKKGNPKHDDIRLSVPQRERMLGQKDRESQGQRRVSAELCQRRNGAEGMELNQEWEATGRIRSVQGYEQETQRGNDTRRW